MHVMHWDISYDHPARGYKRIALYRGRGEPPLEVRYEECTDDEIWEPDATSQSADLLVWILNWLL